MTDLEAPIERRCTTLDELVERLRETDLIPSQRPLLDHIEQRFALLAEAGITSVADLRSQLTDRRRVAQLAADSGVEEDYVALLGRTIRGYFPKPRPIRSFEWLEADVIAALKDAGVTNSEQLRTAFEEEPGDLASRSGVAESDLAALAVLCDLVRVQWISPSFARALVAAGFSSRSAIARADPEHVARAVADANVGHRFYNATIGLRDMQRLVDAARYAPGESPAR